MHFHFFFLTKKEKKNSTTTIKTKKLKTKISVGAFPPESFENANFKNYKQKSKEKKQNLLFVMIILRFDNKRIELIQK